MSTTKVTIVTPPPAPTPPSKVVIELSLEDAKKLKALINLVTGNDLDELWQGLTKADIEACPYEAVGAASGFNRTTVTIKKF